MVQRFQAGEGPAVFVLSLKAGGTGLNLTAANHVIHFDRWWNPAVEDQATDRAFRIGQKKNVQVRKLTCVGTLEERIDTLIAAKKDLADRIVGTGRGVDHRARHRAAARARDALGRRGGGLSDDLVWQLPRTTSVRGRCRRTASQARSRRGAIGETWWSKRFIELLESFGVGSRLKRGRSYARAGQVAELESSRGWCSRRCRDRATRPTACGSAARLSPSSQWRRAEKAMAAQALPLAKLLAGEMPHDIEELLAACKLTLFPRSTGELNASCTCPDAENPCKHIAAAYYILAERFDEDPFSIFTWRGRDQEELTERLRARRAPGSRGKGASARSAQVSRPPEPGTPLSAALNSFWSSGPELEAVDVSPLAGEVPDALLRQLGPAPVEAQGQNLVELLGPAYETLARAAERRALGE